MELFFPFFYMYLIYLSLMILAMVVFPEFLVGVFLKEGEDRTLGIAVEFMFYLWPAFLFNGFNILLSAYLTAMQKPLESTFIAFSRGLTMPALFLLLLPIWFGDIGIFLAMPFAEGVTFLLALFFFKRNMPASLIARQR